MSAEKKPRKQLVERPNIQTLSLKAIVADSAFQPRVETDPAHVLVFDEMIREGHPIHPVAVFWTGKMYILVDGFHRYHAHVKRGLTSIQAVVHQGSERDAMIFAAGANKLTIKALTTADRKKAVMMLLEDEEWRNKSDGEIARHVGLASPQTARKYKLEYEAMSGKKVKLEFRPRPTETRRKIMQAPSGSLSASVNGEQIYLGRDRLAAKEKLRDVMEGIESKRGTKVEAIVRRLASRGVFSVSGRFNSQLKIRCYSTSNTMFAAAEFDDVASVRDAILNVILARKAGCDGGRAVVLIYLEVASKPVLEIIELAKPLGVEFMTPEGFIDSFGAEPSGPDTNAESFKD